VIQTSSISIADLVAAGTVILAIGSTIAHAFHGYFARQRMFEELNELKAEHQILWGIAQGRGWVKGTATGQEMSWTSTDSK
jgi:hypothetical protein